jgi:hypothetical protein
MLVCYARELKEGFADYAEEVVKLMVPMLKFYFHDGVRTAAAESLPYLLDCAKIKGWPSDSNIITILSIGSMDIEEVKVVFFQRLKSPLTERSWMLRVVLKEGSFLLQCYCYKHIYRAKKNVI